jgi:Tat protein translocase TatB subunit
VFGIGGWELLVIAVVALVVLGPKGLPSAARAVGRVASELRRATSDLRQSIELDPELKDLPHALDELNRPLLTPIPPHRRRPPTPLDGAPEDRPNRAPRRDLEPLAEEPDTDAHSIRDVDAGASAVANLPPYAAAAGADRPPPLAGADRTEAAPAAAAGSASAGDASPGEPVEPAEPTAARSRTET